MQESIAGRVLNFVGLTGSPVSAGLVPHTASPFSQDSLTREFNEFGQVVNPETWTRFGNLMNRPTTFTAMLDLWEQMSLWDLLAAALVQVVDEARQHDTSDPGTLWYECDDGKAEEELNDMLEVIEAEDKIPAQIWYLASLGNNFDKIDYARGEGVQGLSFTHPTRVRRYWLKRNRQCIGYRWMDELPNKESLYVNGTQSIQRVKIGDAATEQLWYPWDFLHMRRMYRMRESEHGEPIFEEAQGIYKKLRIALDQVVVARAQLQPDRFVINIDTGDQSTAEQMKTVQRWKQQMRSKLSFGPNDAVEDFKSFYNAMGLDSILYMAKPRGFDHTITKLAGTANVPDVYDVEMLTNLFFSIIGMPKQWLGIGQAEGGPTSGRALLAQDIRFLRKIKSIREPLKNAYTWLGYFHLILKGIDVTNLTLRSCMSDVGSLEDQMKIETLKAQAETLNELSDVMSKFNLPREAWVEVIFRRYMRMPDEIINVFLTALPPEGAPAQESRSPRSNRAQQVLRELEVYLGENERAALAMQTLRDVLAGRPKTVARRITESRVIRVPAMKPRDLIVSSFGRDPTEESNWARQVNSLKLNEEAASSGWKRYDFK